MRVFALLMEPAGYTLDLIREVYEGSPVDYAFQFERSEASDAKVRDVVGCLSLGKRILYLFRQLRAYDAFVVNGYTGLTNVLLILLNALFFRKPMAYESDTELQIPQNRLKRGLKACYLGWLFRRPWSYGFAGGNFSHKDLFRHYGMTEERIFLTPMMVNNAVYAREPQTYPESSFRFCFVGRLVSLKRVDCILEAFRRVVSGGCCAELHIIGDGPERDSLQRLAEGLQGVCFHGAMFGEEKVWQLHRMHALILNSSYESWGLVVNEALAAGIPCIVSDRVGARNDLILGENPTGLVVPWNSVKALKDAMIRLVINRELYETLSRNAVDRMAVWNYDLYRSSFAKFLDTVEKSVCCVN